MNTPTPDQLRLAAEIIEKQLPFEIYNDEHWVTPCSETDDPVFWITDCGGGPAFKIRLKPWVLPDPPAGRQWHRADGWEAKDLPPGYRPLLLGENAQEGDEIMGISGWRPQRQLEVGIRAIKTQVVQRTRRPLPAPPPEPEYVPLEAADVPPGSALKAATDGFKWGVVIAVDLEGVYIVGNVFQSFEYLFRTGWLIFRPGAITWEPCRKLKGGNP